MTEQEIQEHFVLHWGEMGARWGINRTMAQIHALLYLSPEPLPADAITDRLGVARSNVSTSLRELLAWRVVRVVHRFGDRRDHFTTHEDVWSLFKAILEERKRREIDPTRELLRRCIAEAPADSPSRPRLVEMSQLLESAASWYRAVSALPPRLLTRFLRLGDRIPAWLDRDGEP